MKTTTTLLTLLLLSSLCVAQPVQAPVAGGSLENLYKVIENNTAQSQNMQKSMEDLNGRIQETMSSWTGKIIFAESVFMLLMYSIILFFERRHRRLNRKRYEEKIQELEQAQEIKARNNKELLENMNQKLERFIGSIDYFNNLTKEKDIDIRQIEHKAFFNGICYGGLAVIILVKVLGWF
jgi:peptidoglycan hydrolase CwlO-like protein